MTIVRANRYQCHARRDKGICDNPRGVDAARIENQVCELLSLHIAAECSLPELVRHAAEESARRRERLTAAIADGKQRIARLLDAIEQGAQSHAAHQRILEIEHETGSIEVELDSLPVIPSHTPGDLAARLHERLATLNRTIADGEPGTERRAHALLAARDLIERIDIAPLPERGRVSIAIRPRTDSLVAFALQEKWAFTPETSVDTA